MWYEALPSLFLVGAFVCAPYGIVPLMQKLVNGNMYGRKVATTEALYCDQRDTKKSGSRYAAAGLEAISDN